MRILFAAIAALCSLNVIAADNTQPFTPYTLQDQHGEEHTLNPETRTVIMAFEMGLAKTIHKWLATEDPDFLARNKAEYVVDISPMPAVITKLFAGPKMRRYPFPIIQAVSEDFADRYPNREGKITIFLLDEKQENAVVHFVSSAAEAAAVLDPELTSTDIGIID